MNSRKPKQTSTVPSSDTLSHSRDLLLALSRVTQSIQKARTAEDFYQVIGREIKSLDGEVTLLMMNDDNRSLTAVYTSYAPSLLRRIEKLTGKPVFGYQLDFPPDSVYARNLAAGRTEYFHWTAELIAEALPQSIRLLAGQFIKILKFDDIILAPLLVDDETLGLMLVSGSFLNENDVAVMEIFAGQTAVGLRNVRLLQKLQDELAARRQAEEALKKSEAQYRLLADHMTDMIWLVDMNLKTTYVSPSVEKIRGFTLEQIQELPLDRNFTPESLQLAMELIANEFSRVQADPSYLPLKTVELDFLNHDGSIYSTETKLSVIRDEAGNPVSVLGESGDIAERKQAEEALIRSEQTYRALFENMPIGLYHTSIDGHILDVNQALVDMFGYSDRPSLLKMKTEDLYISPASNIGVKEGSVEKDGHFTFEVEFRRYDQQTFWAEDNFHIVCDSGGVPLYYEGSLIDITNRKHAEEELLRATQSLEAAHRELQQTLANEQLLARTDGLTGLYNRRYFHELAAREFIAAIRYQRPLTIMLFDLDGLKQINDTFGHELGDTFLMLVAEIASAQVRNVDVLARYGGDEFIILFPQTNARDAYLIAERFCTTIESVKVATGGDPLSATISAGIAEIDHARLNKSVEDTIRFADQAMYRAKQKGRNCIEIYAPGANED